MLAILDSRRRRTGPGRMQRAGLVSALAGFALLVGGLSPAPRAMVVPTATGADALPEQLALGNEIVDSKATETQRLAVEEPKAKKPKPAKETRPQTKAEDTRDAEADSDAGHEGNDAQRAQILAKSLRTDSEVEVRRVAAWGLAQYANQEVAAKALAEAVTQEANEEVRETATWSLANSNTPAAIAAIDAALRRDKSAKVRKTAAWAAGSMGSPSFADGLTLLLGDPDPEIREVAAWSFANCSPKRAPAGLIRLLNDSSRDVRLSAAWALHVISDPSTADELEAAFRREKDPEVQRGLIRALGSMGDAAVPTLTRLVDSPDPEVRAIAIAALAGSNISGPWPWPRPEPRPFP